MFLFEKNPLGLPFENHLLIRSPDNEQIQEVVSDQIETRKITFLKPTAPERSAILTHISLNSTHLLAAHFKTPVRIASENVDYMHLMFPLQGFIKNQCKGQGEITARPNTALLHFPNQPLSVDWSPDCKVIVVMVHQQQFHQYLHEAYQTEGSPPQCDRFSTLIDLQRGTGRSLATMIRTICAEAEYEDSLLLKQTASKQFENLLFEALLNTQTDTYRALLEQQPACLPGHIKRARDYLMSHLEEEVLMTDLVAASGAGKRTLESGFAKYYHVGPMHFIKQMKLQKIHEALLAADPTQTTVGDIAARWGFYHLSNFAANYTRQFGEKPSATLRQR